MATRPVSGCCVWLLLALAISNATALEQLRLTQCSQSSVGWDGVCGRAIDGNTDQHYFHHSCSYTLLQYGWWQARTTELAHFQQVRIVNRADCCSDRLTNFVVTVDGHECASYNSPSPFSVHTFNCNRVGHVLRIATRKITYLTLCEVQAFGEYLASKSGSLLPLSQCSQSSVGWDGVCSRAIDGNTDQHYFHHSCSHTLLEKGWWVAKTQKLAHFKEVRIYNRQDCCSERLTNFVITVDGHECASYNSRSVFSVKTFACNKVGRVLKIQSQESTYLTLCEVQAFGEYAAFEQLPLSQCSQSSVGWNGVCGRAIDGNTDQHYFHHSCSHTLLENGWWVAKTKKLAHIREVRIYNRQDCCSERLTNFVITVDGHECASYNSRSAFSVQVFSCDRVGSVVMIQSRAKTYLTLCEVQVFGTYTAARQRGSKLTLSTCFQTSVGWNGVCHRAIDGNTAQNYGQNSCSHTNDNHGQSHGSMKTPAHVKEVVIYNRLDCCTNRLNNFAVFVDGQLCARYQSSEVFSVIRLNCDKVGQNVVIITYANTYLTLCEVEVFGEKIAQPKTRSDLLPLSQCSQSSVGWDGVCSRAIDGNANQFYWGYSCTHTQLENGWWAAKTKKLAHIKEVKIFNRLDCCSERLTNFVITVDGHECASYNSRSVFSVKSFKCNAIGRSVVIRSRATTYLTLCEVQVFGDYEDEKPKFKYIGCFQDNKEHPDFSEGSEASSAMTHVRCNNLCKSKGATYFALQSGSQCFCGENYGSNGEAENKDCSTPCSGDSGSKCGGSLRNAVFQVDKSK